ncbi:MAG: hypothetical protein IPP40_01555 [bacterium]|nr:hypothetical protein [bacterium]
MKQRCFTLLLVTCLLFGAASVQAGYEIYFQNGTVLPADFEFRLDNQVAGEHAILQFYDALTAADRARLESAGIELLGYLPERAFAVKMTRMVTQTELTSLGVRAAIPFAPEFKLHPRVQARDFGSWSEFENGARMFNVDIFSDVPLDVAAKLLEDSGYLVGDHIDALHTLVVAADPGKILDLAGLDPVLFINEVSPPLESLNSTVRTRLHVNEVQAAPYNLSGDGVTILVFDGGMVDETHP